MMRHWHSGVGMGMGVWGWTLMTLGTLIVWGLLIALGVALYRGWQRPQNPAGGQDTALRDADANANANANAQRILAERFARGDIDEAEYRERSAVLRDRTSH